MELPDPISDEALARAEQYALMMMNTEHKDEREWAEIVGALVARIHRAEARHPGAGEKAAHGTLYEQRHEIDTMRDLLRDCARALQYNLAMRARKDEQVMHKALLAVWEHIGRDYCECPSGYPNHAEGDHAG